MVGFPTRHAYSACHLDEATRHVYSTRLLGVATRCCYSACLYSEAVGEPTQRIDYYSLVAAQPHE
jgi:hypothetical protein